MTTKDKALVVIHGKNGCVLLMAKGSGKKRKWGFPGGKIETKESPAMAALREVKEETGISLMNLTEEKVLKDINHKIYVFTSMMYSNLDITLSKEHTDYQWVKKINVRTMKLNRGARIIVEGKGL